MGKVDIIPQRTNANRHTPRGMGELERSIQEDGWIGAITVAADGETFDGSARVETLATVGLREPLIIDVDGSQPVVVRRTDISSADDPRAKRLAVAANKIAADNLDWDASVLAALSEEVDLSQLFRDDEFAEILQRAADGILIPDPEPQKEPTLASECYVEVYCARADLNDFRATLNDWSGRAGVTVNIQE